ncbi:MAG: hypothetical protein GX557_14655 [Chloroflexi bacterium]|nr:hypothetical protein [Chloroflexota bacterium]
MRLGLVVVYLVKPGNEALLDLHLRQIERCTSVPYTIYASANRLDAACRARLERDPHVRVCSPPTTPLRGGSENAHYLELLTEQAAADDVTHIATLHVDAFPVRMGWAGALAAQLSEARPLAAIERLENGDHKPHSAFMLFTRDWYLSERPRYMLTPAERKTLACRRYALRYPHVPDTGSGYGYRLYRRRLQWVSLKRSNAAEDHYMLGSVYGDWIFHLGAAARDVKLFRADARLLSRVGVLRSLRGWLASQLSPEQREWLHQRRPAFVDSLAARGADNEAAFEAIKARLLAGPDDYLTYLRTGQHLR